MPYTLVNIYQFFYILLNNTLKIFYKKKNYLFFLNLYLKRNLSFLLFHLKNNLKLPDHYYYKFYIDHFDPEYFKINDIVDWIKDNGNEISVVTGNPNYPKGKIYPGYSTLGSFEKKC